MLSLFLVIARLTWGRPSDEDPAWGRVPLPETLEPIQGLSLLDMQAIGSWQGWELGPPPPPESTWHPSSRQGYRGRSWRVGPDEGGYANRTLQWLETAPISIRRSSRLSFRLRYQTESPDEAPQGFDGWDGGNVWVSVDGGVWKVLSGFSHGYTCRSLYSFGEEFGLGDEVPGWSGRSDWRKVHRDLGSFAGHRVAFRFAFCSDGAEGEDERFSGLQLDDILVQSGSTIQLKNDADGTALPAPLVALAGRPADPWVPAAGFDTESTLSWIPRPGKSTQLHSPLWQLSEASSLQLAFCTGLADSSDGELQGELRLDLTTDEGRSWERLWQTSLRAGEEKTLLSLDRWAGHAVRLRWSVTVTEPRRADGQALGRLWLRQVDLRGCTLPRRDLDLAEVVPAYPRTEGLPCDVLVQVRNRGAEDLPPVGLLLSLDGADPLPVPTARPLPAGQTQDAASCWMPEQAGPHDLLAWLDGARDERSNNDSLWVGPVDVLPAGELEFGYSFQEGSCYFREGDPLLFVDELPRLDVGDFTPTRVTIGFCDPENRADGKTIRLHILEDNSGSPGRERWSADYRLESLGWSFLWEFEVEEEIRLGGSFWVWAERREDYPHVLGAPLLWKPGHYALSRAGEAELDFSRGASGHELLFWVSGTLLPPEPPAPAVPTDLAITGAHPNPFNPTTSLSFQAPEGEAVSLRVYNLAGQEVALLFDGHATGQSQTAHFDAGRLASGVYFACLESESRVSTHKLVLSK